MVMAGILRITNEYGGPKLDEKKVKVKSATVSADRKKELLEFDGQKGNHTLLSRLVTMKLRSR
jgi:cytochrome c